MPTQYRLRVWTPDYSTSQNINVSDAWMTSDGFTASYDRLLSCRELTFSGRILQIQPRSWVRLIASEDNFATETNMFFGIVVQVPNAYGHEPGQYKVVGPQKRLQEIALTRAVFKSADAGAMLRAVFADITTAGANGNAPGVKDYAATLDYNQIANLNITVGDIYPRHQSAWEVIQVIMAAIPAYALVFSGDGFPYIKHIPTMETLYGIRSVDESTTGVVVDWPDVTAETVVTNVRFLGRPTSTAITFENGLGGSPVVRGTLAPTVPYRDVAMSGTTLPKSTRPLVVQHIRDLVTPITSHPTWTEWTGGTVTNEANLRDGDTTTSGTFSVNNTVMQPRVVFTSLAQLRSVIALHVAGVPFEWTLNHVSVTADTATSQFGAYGTQSGQIKITAPAVIAGDLVLVDGNALADQLAYNATAGVTPTQFSLALWFDTRSVSGQATYTLQLNTLRLMTWDASKLDGLATAYFRAPAQNVAKVMLYGVTVNNAADPDAVTTQINLTRRDVNGNVRGSVLNLPVQEIQYGFNVSSGPWTAYSCGQRGDPSDQMLRDIVESRDQAATANAVRAGG